VETVGCSVACPVASVFAMVITRKWIESTMSWRNLPRNRKIVTN
jgi:hypothetical protein